MLTAAGVGSGLDIENIISQLMVLERRPLTRLEEQKGDVELKISANGQLRSAISRLEKAASTLTDSDALGGVKGSSSDEDVLSVSAQAGADTQSHAIEVVRIASQHRMGSTAFADADTQIGSGNLDITVGGQTLSLSLSTGNNTLAAIRDAINDSGDNPGVTASIITVDAGAKLILTANETGTANAITVTPDAGLAGFGFSQIGTLDDALVRIDGFDLTSGSNTITGAIAGATLELKAAGTADVRFATDSSAISDAVKELVNAYNFVRGNVKALRDNALAGDSVLLSLESRINAELAQPITLTGGGTGYLFEAGVSFNKDGDLQFDAAELSSAVAEDPTRVLDLFAAQGSGIAARLDAVLSGYTRTDGLIDGRVESLESRGRAVDRLIDNAQFRLDKTEERLRAQFTALDALISQLSVTGDYLAQQLLSLPQNNRQY
jgi:flagellar hook-associated protein 2